MSREIKIKIASGFDPSGVSAASAALDKMVDDLEKSNKWLMQCNAELSGAIKKHASSVAVDMAAAADKAAKGIGNTCCHKVDSGVLLQLMGHYAGINAVETNDIRLLVQQQAIDDCDAVFSISCHMDEFLIAVTNAHPKVAIPPNWPNEGALDDTGILTAYNLYQEFQSSQAQIDGLVSVVIRLILGCCCN